MKRIPDQATPKKLRGIFTAAALGAIRFYQAALRPLMPWGCKYYPSCSAYAVEAIESKGLERGLALATRRLLRCRPGTFGGYDPVPDEPAPQSPIPGSRACPEPVPPALPVLSEAEGSEAEGSEAEGSGVEGSGVVRLSLTVRLPLMVRLLLTMTLSFVERVTVPSVSRGTTPTVRLSLTVLSGRRSSESRGVEGRSRRGTIPQVPCQS